MPHLHVIHFVSDIPETKNVGAELQGDYDDIEEPSKHTLNVIQNSIVMQEERNDFSRTPPLPLSAEYEDPIFIGPQVGLVFLHNSDYYHGMLAITKTPVVIQVPVAGAYEWGVFVPPQVN